MTLELSSDSGLFVCEHPECKGKGTYGGVQIRKERQHISFYCWEHFNEELSKLTTEPEPSLLVETPEINKLYTVYFKEAGGTVMCCTAAYSQKYKMWLDYEGDDLGQYITGKHPIILGAVEIPEELKDEM